MFASITKTVVGLLLPVLQPSKPTDPMIRSGARIIGDLAVRFATIAVDPDAWLKSAIDEFLSPAEHARREQIADPGSSRAFALGRIAAKHLLIEQAWLAPEQARLASICSVDEQGNRSRPSLWIGDERISVRFCIAHLPNMAVASLRAGCDLVDARLVDPLKLKPWLTPFEREQTAGDPRAAALCWAVKEAVYKVLNAGEPFRPKQFEVNLSSMLCVYTRSPSEHLESRFDSWVDSAGVLFSLAIPVGVGHATTRSEQPIQSSRATR